MVNKLENVFFQAPSRLCEFQGFDTSSIREHVLLLWIPEVRTSAGLEGGSLANEGSQETQFLRGHEKMGHHFGGM